MMIKENKSDLLITLLIMTKLMPSYQEEVKTSVERLSNCFNQLTTYQLFLFQFIKNYTFIAELNYHDTLFYDVTVQNYFSPDERT